MKLVEFSQGASKVLIDPEKVACIEKTEKDAKSRQMDWPPPVVYLSFVWGSGQVEFHGKDAEIVWHYFYNYGLAKPATLD